MIFLFDLLSGGYSRITTHPESPTTPPYQVRLNSRPHLQDTRNQEVLYPPKQPTQPPKPPPKTFNIPRRVIPTPVLPKVDKDNFYAWNQRRTVKHCIGGVQMIQDYHVDTHRWSTVFSKHLGSAPPLTPGPIEKKKRPSKWWAPYSSPESPALYGVFVRPGCGGVKEKVILARYLGAVIPFSAPELKEDGSRYLFELHDRIRGSKKN